MWLSILGLVGEVLKFAVKWATQWLDHNEERRKERKNIHENEIKTATSQRDLIMAINRYNRVR